MGIVVAPSVPRDADGVGDAVQLEGMMPIRTRLGRKIEGRRDTTATTSLMSQVDEPHGHKRGGLAAEAKRPAPR